MDCEILFSIYITLIYWQDLQCKCNENLTFQRYVYDQEECVLRYALKFVSYTKCLWLVAFETIQPADLSTEG